MMATRKAKPSNPATAVVSGRQPSFKTVQPNKGVEVEGVRLSHPEKILDTQTKLTKRELAEYYAAVADHLLPHIADRPLSIVRCPDGSDKPCFFQKHVGMGVPEEIGSVEIRSKKGGPAEQYLTVSSREGLVALAQLGVMEVHPWGSRNESLEMPDRIIIDLDPDSAISWKRLVESAVVVRDIFKQIGLESFVKSTGGKGLHVVVPIQPEREWAAIKDFSHHLVLLLERADPGLYLTKMTKSARKGRIFLDYLRNERGATAVAPWSPRARPGARVAVPFTWTELKRSDLPQFAAANLDDWKSRLKRDPWIKMVEMKQWLTDEAFQAVSKLVKKSS